LKIIKRTGMGPFGVMDEVKFGRFVFAPMKERFKTGFPSIPVRKGNSVWNWPASSPLNIIS
jgi:hypothetical protein